MTQSAITFAALETSERPLFGEQTVGSLVRNVWRVYRDHFVLIAYRPSRLWCSRKWSEDLRPVWSWRCCSPTR